MLTSHLFVTALMAVKISHLSGDCCHTWIGLVVAWQQTDSGWLVGCGRCWRAAGREIGQWWGGGVCKQIINFYESNNPHMCIGKHNSCIVSMSVFSGTWGESGCGHSGRGERSLTSRTQSRTRPAETEREVTWGLLIFQLFLAEWD